MPFSISPIWAASRSKPALSSYPPETYVVLAATRPPAAGPVGVGAERGRKPVEAGPLVVSAGDVRRVGGHPPPDLGVELAAGELLHRARRHRAELLVRDRLAAVSDQVKVRGQEVVVAQVVDRGDELPGREVAGWAEDDHDGRRGAAVLAKTLQKWVSVGVGHGRRRLFCQVRG